MLIRNKEVILIKKMFFHLLILFFYGLPLLENLTMDPNYQLAILNFKKINYNKK